MKSINILGMKYSIESAKDLGRDEGAAGRCSSNLCNIQIDATLPKQRKEWVLFHEILEGIVYELEIELNHRDLSRISASYHQVLKDNDMLKEIKL